MPLFEFECHSCSKRYEELVSVTRKSVAQCPECKSKDVRKLVSAGSFRGVATSSTSVGTSSSSCSPTGG